MIYMNVGFPLWGVDFTVVWPGGLVECPTGTVRGTILVGLILSVYLLIIVVLHINVICCTESNM